MHGQHPLFSTDNNRSYNYSRRSRIFKGGDGGGKNPELVLFKSKYVYLVDSANSV